MCPEVAAPELSKLCDNKKLVRGRGGRVGELLAGGLTGAGGVSGRPRGFNMGVLAALRKEWFIIGIVLVILSAKVQPSIGVRGGE